MNSLERGLAILDVLEAASSPMTAYEISQVLEIPVSTLYRYLNVIKSKNIIEEVNGKFSLGLRCVAWASKVPFVNDLAKLSLPYLEALSKEIGETVLLLRPAGDTAMCVERVEADQAVKYSFYKGKKLPLHAGASARIVMAFLPDEEINKVINQGLERFSDNTITDPDRLWEELRKTRVTGYAISDYEMDPGVRAIAVPILAKDGQFLAGLSVVGPMFRLTPGKTESILKELRNTANMLSERLSPFARTFLGGF